MAIKDQPTPPTTLTPKLRFPEFTTDWRTKRLDAIAQPITERAENRPITPYTVTTGVGLVSQQDRFGRTIAGSAFKNYYVLRKDDFAYNKSATKAFPQGYIARFRGEEGAVPNSIFTCFRALPNAVNPAYLDYLFAGNLHGRWLRRFIEVSARAHGSLSIDDADLMSLPVPLPEGTSSAAEQRKIAACLTSLDELLAGEGRKLEVLRSHKKGLMQQLFPRDGENVPRLRFPEFQNAGEWERLALGDLCRFVRGPFGGALKKDIFVSDGFAVYEQSHAIDNEMRAFRYFITAEKYAEMKRFAVKPADIIMSCSGTMGKFAQLPSDPVPGVINQALLKLSVHEKSSAEFILLVLGLPATQLKLLTQSAGGAIKNVLGVPQLKEIEIPMPQPAEQQRIAACLSSLDALIAAASRKLDGLRAHKKGLMQQLFPFPETE